MSRYAEIQAHLRGMSTQLLQYHLMPNDEEKRQLRKETHRDVSKDCRYQLAPFDNLALAGRSSEDREVYERMWANTHLTLNWYLVCPPTGRDEVIYFPATRLRRGRRVGNTARTTTFPRNDQERTMPGVTKFHSRCVGFHLELDTEALIVRDIAEHIKCEVFKDTSSGRWRAPQHTCEHHFAPYQCDYSPIDASHFDWMEMFHTLVLTNHKRRGIDTLALRRIDGPQELFRRGHV